jgi:tRNA pseudouridine55 synthase
MTLHVGIKETVHFDEGETILVNKPIDWTSFDVVARLRSMYGIKKIGHAGTLDPKADGLLIVCTGKMTKQISEFQDYEKEYTGFFELGATTSSYDTETEVIEKRDPRFVTSEMIASTFASFLGVHQQIPPMYSAVKVHGKRLYKYARKGKEIVREPREVNIKEFSMTSFQMPVIGFTVICSKGTYIRSLANDCGVLLGCGAFLRQLTRTRIGPFRVEEAMNVSDFHILGSKIQQAMV